MSTEQQKEQGREYRKKNKERIRIWQREYHKIHKEDPEHHRRRGRELYRKQKYKVLSHYSNGDPQCLHCGITDIDVLSLDHIDGGGTQHKKVTGGHNYRWIINNNFPGGFQILCFNCNWKKRLHQI